jgi:hypothetical protein
MITTHLLIAMFRNPLLVLRDLPLTIVFGEGATAAAVRVPCLTREFIYHAFTLTA